MNTRKSGILLHVTSLPSDYGIGDLGPEAYKFVDFLKSSGQKYWQILPINPTEILSGSSPYSTPSSFALNDLLISPQLLLRDGYISNEDLKKSPAFSSKLVDYKKVVQFKKGIIKRAYRLFLDSGRGEKAFNLFKAEQKSWLRDFALFMVIKNITRGKVWNKWPKGLKFHELKAIKFFTGKHSEKIDQVMFAQFLVDQQWRKLRKYCRKQNIKIIGDLPIYVIHNSVDVWKNQGIFKLDKKLEPLFVAGVPPDYFCEDGQRWGNPVYDWKKLARKKFGWWIDRLKINMDRFDYLRVDHFRGLVQYWEIPVQEKTARAGYWADVPTTKFLDTIKARFSNRLPIIAEDLGTITPDVHAVMKKYHLPGMKVLQFAFEGNMVDHPYLPHNFEERCLVYTGTHDNNTVRGWYRKEASIKEKSNLKGYLNRNITVKSVHLDLIEMAMMSPANTAIIPMQDILGLDESARMNKPGYSSGNWIWRVKKADFRNNGIKYHKKLTFRSKRY